MTKSMKKTISWLCVIAVVFSVIMGCTGVAFASEHGDAFAQKLTEVKKMIDLKDYLSAITYTALETTYNKYKDVNPDAIDEQTANEAISEMETALCELQPKKAVVLTGQSYSKSYLLWLKQKDSKAPNIPASTKASVLTEYCSGCDSNTPYPRAMDGEKGNDFHLQGTWEGGPTVVTFDFGGIQYVNRVDICNCPDNVNAKSLGKITIETSTDLTSWNTVSDFTPDEFSAWKNPWDAQLIKTTFKLTPARYVRITAKRANYCTRISEIGISGFEHPAASLQIKLDEAKSTIEGIGEFERYYTKEKTEKLKNDYNTISSKKLEELGASDILEYTQILDSDIKAVKDDVNGSVILSGQHLDADTVKWFKEQDPTVPIAYGSGTVSAETTGFSGGERCFDGTISGSPAYGTWDTTPVIKVDMGEEQIIGRIDFVENCHASLDAYQISSIDVETSLDGEIWTMTAILTDVPPITVANSSDLATIKFPYTKARYVRVTPHRSGHAVNCRELVIYGFENPSVSVNAALAESEKYMNSAKYYSTESVINLEAAVKELKACPLDSSKLSDYIENVYSAIEGLEHEEGSWFILSGQNLNDAAVNAWYPLSWKLPFAKNCLGNPMSYAWNNTDGFGGKLLITDGDVSTKTLWSKWDNRTPINVVFDLGTVCAVDRADVIHTAESTQNIGNSKVYLSMDGADYSLAGSYDSSVERPKGASPREMSVNRCMKFPATEARYVKIEIEPKNQCLLTEIVIFGCMSKDDSGLEISSLDIKGKTETGNTVEADVASACGEIEYLWQHSDTGEAGTFENIGSGASLDLDDGCSGYIRLSAWAIAGGVKGVPKTVTKFVEGQHILLSDNGAEVAFAINAEESDNHTVIIAFFDENGQLVNCKTESLDLEPGENIKIYNAKPDDGVYSYSIYLWDGLNTIKPVRDEWGGVYLYNGDMVTEINGKTATNYGENDVSIFGN